jgi:glycosyltransferase involved in cell wall biosynthesis
MKLVESNLLENTKNNRLMLFDLALGGHHGNYIRYLIDYWYEQNLAGSLFIVVLPKFLEVHQDIVETIFKYQNSSIQIITISEAEAASLNSRQPVLSRLVRNLQEWNLYCHYATSLQASTSLIMYLDTCEIPLFLGRASPCPFTGIYFRPTFHYTYFANYQSSWKNKLQHLREKLTLWRILKHPQLKTFFCLDPLAIKYIEKFSSQAKILHLPDPIEITEQSNTNLEKIKTNLAIDSNKKIFLLFGALDGRKGIYQLLDAIALLPDEFCQKLCLLLIGGTNSREQTKIETQVTAICQHKPVQIIQLYQFIPESDVTAYFQIADIVLAPYQKHTGMSGILLQGAAAGKVILSSNYGLMGEIVKRYKLGLGVDSTNPREIMKALTKCLLEPPVTLCDREEMAQFIGQHSHKNYTKIIFKHIL